MARSVLSPGTRTALALGIRGPIQAYSSMILAATPTAYWRMGEASGNIADSSGNALTGTQNGSPTYAQPGGLPGDTNTSINLPANTAFFNVGTQSLLNAAGSWTIDCWIKPSNVAATLAVVAARGVETDVNFIGWNVRLDSAKVHFRVRTPTENAINSSTSLVNGVWYHIVCVYNSGTNQMLVYVNGQLENTGSVTGSISSYSTITQIGRESGNTVDNNHTFQGNIQDLAIYNSALSAATIAQHYAAGLSDPRLVLNRNFSNCLSLNGTSDYVTCGNGATLQILSTLTLSAWINITAFTAAASPNNVIMSKFDNTIGRGYILYVESDGTLNFQCSSNGIGSGATTIASKNPVPLSQFVHVAATFNAGAMRVYINGVLVASGSGNTSIFNTAQVFEIGARNQTAVSFFKGRIDDVRVYNTALSQAQLFQIYAQNDSSTDTVGTGNLVAYWKFDAGSGSSAVDSSGNTNTGTLQSTATWSTGPSFTARTVVT